MRSYLPLFLLFLSVFVIATVCAIPPLSAFSRNNHHHLKLDDGVLRLVVAFCPTDFTGAGAIVDFNVKTGSYKVQSRFDWPSDVFGCVADYDPTYAYDPVDPTLLWFDFTSDTGYFVAVDTIRGNTSHFASSSLFFSGFSNFEFNPLDGTLRGLTPTVTQGGLCSDGCFGYGIQHTPPSAPKYERKSIVPFKAAMDDTSLIQPKLDTFYFQGSYDLRDRPCAPVQSGMCLVTLNYTTGELVSAIYTPEYTVYKFASVGKQPLSPVASASLDVLAWMEGFDSFCKNDAGGNYLFGTVNLKTAKGTPIACIPKGVEIHMDEWISTFSANGKMFATASGDAEGENSQLLVFNTATGAVEKKSDLSDLGKLLKADMKLIWIWAIQF